MSFRFLLHTDTCVAFLDAADVRLRDRWLQTPAADIALCSVVKTELYRGAWGSRDPLGVLARLERFLGQFRSLPFDDLAAHRCGRLIAELDRSGRPIGAFDCMIAAVALEADLTVVTRNERHFRRVKGLRVTRW